MRNYNLISSLILMALLISCNQKHKNLTSGFGSGIVNGQKAFPTSQVKFSTVALVENTDEKAAFCTGTLISNDIVITAFHCLENIDKEDFRIVFGLTAKNISTNEIYEIEAIRLHDYKAIFDEEGDFLTAENDLAIVKLNKQAPAWTIPALVASQLLIKTSDQIILSGFGVNDDKEMSQLPDLFFTLVPVEKITNNIIVTNQTANTGACAGDSGGPAYITNKSGKHLIVIGATRGPHEQAYSCHEFGEYTRTDNQTEFIRNSIIDVNGQLPTFVNSTN